MPTYYIDPEEKTPAVVASDQEMGNIKNYQGQWVDAVNNPVPSTFKHVVYHETSCSAPYKTNSKYTNWSIYDVDEKTLKYIYFDVDYSDPTSKLYKTPKWPIYRHDLR